MNNPVLTCDRCGSPITNGVHWAVDQALCAGCHKVGEAAKRTRLVDFPKWLEINKLPKVCNKFWVKQINHLTRRMKDEQRKRQEDQIAAIRAYARSD